MDRNPNEIEGGFMKITNKNVLINKLTAMLKKDWYGEKGHLTDNEMFKYCEFYTGDFWKKLEESNKKVA